MNIASSRQGLRAAILCLLLAASATLYAQDWWKPYAPSCVERENVFVFTEKPAVKLISKDRYEISFAVEGFCDVTVGLVDEKGVVVRHLASGVLGKNAPAPFQKDTLAQKIYWNGKDDLGTYVKEPEKLTVRVQLGFKPEFDKLLLGKGMKSLTPWVWGIAIGPDGAYVFTKASGGGGPGTDGHVKCRKFDRDGNYVLSLFPPPANMPQEKLGGYGFIEYEPGVRAVHGVGIGDAISDRSHVFETTAGHSVLLCQPFVLGQKLHFFGRGLFAGKSSAFLHRIHTDGSTDAQEISVPLGENIPATFVRMAASPDGKWLYLVGGNTGLDRGYFSVVWRVSMAGGQPATVFLGDQRAGGSDNRHFQDARGLDCDATGRLYVADRNNNRIQIFSAEGKHLKTVAVDRPEQVRVHAKTGALYVMHQARVKGTSLSRLTKFTSFDAPVAECQVDNVAGQAMAVDAWTAKARVWVGTGGNIVIYEEDGKTFKKIDDFQEDAKKEEGGNYSGQYWCGKGCCGEGKVVCDPVREQVYFANAHVFDLKTGAKLGNVRLHGIIDDIAFDKRGYVHCHFNPGYYEPGVGRLDPTRSSMDGQKNIVYAECPYDYGVQGRKDKWWKGIIPVKDQPGAKFFQDGIGVNMRGDVAVQSNLYYAPKMEEEATAFAMVGAKLNTWGEGNGGESMAGQVRFVKEMEKLGNQVYWIKRRPGIPVMGATVWAYDWNGELRQELAVNAGGLITGVQMDEEGCVYFVANQASLRGGRPFLGGKGGTFGVPGDKRGANPLLGTLMKTNGKKTRFILKHAPVPLEEGAPKRPADLAGDVWVEGMEWLYAGASPMPHGCSCPTIRSHLDWYKRTFVPEAYRHSFGVLDTAGNLIMHLGKYGNYDSGNGAKSKIPVGGDNIGVYIPRFISGTDNYLVFS
ncbi:hypothetical protein ACFL01_02205, partial [Planctomycetota bacterium]